METPAADTELPGLPCRSSTGTTTKEKELSINENSQDKSCLYTFTCFESKHVLAFSRGWDLQSSPHV